MSTPQDPELTVARGADSVLTVEDATCTACGCLCDDLILTVAEGKITEAKNACEIGRRWFLANHGHADLPKATIEGRPVTLDEALDRAAQILQAARAPIVLGLTQTTTEAVASALAVADRVGATVDPGASCEANRRLLAVQRIGRVSATLGEVKNRAEIVVFWGVDPVVTHPRHWERYSVEPRGRFVPKGRAGRTVVVVDTERTATAKCADWFVPVAPEARFATLWTLRALVGGAKLDPDHVKRATGVDWDILHSLATRLTAAHYGAWFVGEELGRSPGGSATVEAALSLVRDLNKSARFVILPLGGPGNAAGAEAALTWQTGFASSVSLTQGYPRSLPGVTSAEELLAAGAIDAALIVADLVPSGLSDLACAHLASIPKIVIAPRATAPGISATVAINAATFGIDAPGTVMRSDGVVLPLRPPLAASVPTDRELLRAIEKRLET